MPTCYKVRMPKNRFEEGRVIVVNDRAALIVATGKDYSRIEYQYVESDGSLGSPGHFRNWESETKDIKFVDFAKVRTVVDLPPEWKEKATAYEVKEAVAEKAERERREEWEPERHPSYGQISVSRVSGHSALFGSPFNHQHYLTISIGRSTRHRNLGHDRHYGGFRGELVEVALSEAQWSHFVSGVGVGMGVPCTLRYVGGQEQENCPEQSEINRFHDDIEKDVKNATKFMADAMAKMTALADDKAPTKEKRKEALAALVKAGRALEDSAPFIARQLHERMDVVVNEAKTEVEAYVLRTIVDSGVQKLAELNAKDGKKPSELPFTFNATDEKNPKSQPKLIEAEVVKKEKP